MPSAGPSDEAQALSAMIAEPDRTKIERIFAPMEASLARRATLVFGADDSTVASKITTAVHAEFSPLYPDLVAAETDVYATQFSLSELRGIAAFLAGPVGQAERTNLPLLGRELTKATSGTADRQKMQLTAKTAFAAATGIRRAAILRIFKAQNLEAHTRQGFLSLMGVWGAAASGGVKSPEENDQRDLSPNGQREAEQLALEADAYVQLVMAVELDFYATHYSDAEITGLADYLESDAGKAAVARKPLIARAASVTMANHITSISQTFGKSICAALTCSPDQRAKLDAEAHSLVAILPALRNFTWS
jgi:hypothetical protein